MSEGTLHRIRNPSSSTWREFNSEFEEAKEIWGANQHLPLLYELGVRMAINKLIGNTNTAQKELNASKKVEALALIMQYEVVLTTYLRKSCLKPCQSLQF